MNGWTDDPKRSQTLPYLSSKEEGWVLGVYHYGYTQIKPKHVPLRRLACLFSPLSNASVSQLLTSSTMSNEVFIFATVLLVNVVTAVISHHPHCPIKQWFG